MNAPKFYEWQKNKCEAKNCPHLYHDGQNGNDSEGPKLLKLCYKGQKSLWKGLSTSALDSVFSRCRAGDLEEGGLTYTQT